MNALFMPRRQRLFVRFCAGFAIAFLISILGGCLFAPSIPKVDSLESARSALFQAVLPKMQVATEVVSDAVASRYSVDQIQEPLPQIEEFPLYSAHPSGGNEVYLEIFSSTEKANVDRQNERWLVEVADAFNARNETLPSGQPIRVGIRKIASGTAARLLEAGTVKPQGFSPSNDLWVSMVQSVGVKTTEIAP
ncbi:MAG TPA: hypothetical protein V6D06_11155, partial [Trichocoleus sp.]